MIVSGCSRGIAENPAVRAHVRVHRGERDRPLQALERPEDHGPVRPWARERDIQMVAPGFGAQAGRAVRGHPVAKYGLGADELAPRLAGIAGYILPAPSNSNPIWMN